MHDHEPTENTCPHGSRPVDERCDVCWREENGDDIDFGMLNARSKNFPLMSSPDFFDGLDFAMLTPPTGPGSAKASAAPEQDPTEARLERERKKSPYKFCPFCERRRADCHSFESCIEVKHGSGKVKV